jgi:hypothetical protein
LDQIAPIQFKSGHGGLPIIAGLYVICHLSTLDRVFIGLARIAAHGSPCEARASAGTASRYLI